jgi:BolA protein
MSLNLLHERLNTLKPSKLEIRDDSALHKGHQGNAGGGHFSVTIESSLFSGKSTIIRHRLVYQALGDLIPSRIHALSINALAPDDHR